jgi:hypothetical protein
VSSVSTKPSRHGISVPDTTSSNSEVAVKSNNTRAAGYDSLGVSFEANDDTKDEGVRCSEEEAVAKTGISDRTERRHNLPYLGTPYVTVKFLA